MPTERRPVLIDIHSLPSSGGPMASSRPVANNASALRVLRAQLGLSQAECATALGVAVETFRAWDAGRRPTPEAIVFRAQTLKPKRTLHQQVPLHVLAKELHIHLRTLRAAARDGRLDATFARRLFFGKLTATATREAAVQFMAKWYRRSYGRGRSRPVAVCRVTVPENYVAALVGLRLRLGLSQQQLANKLGAASKAVVYQWESGKRRPSPVFWLRVERLSRLSQSK
jgi:DNA-binding transcriptional regulator YiaG